RGLAPAAPRQCADDLGTGGRDPRRHRRHQRRTACGPQHSSGPGQRLLEAAPPILGVGSLAGLLQQAVGLARRRQCPILCLPRGADRRTHEAICSCCHDCCPPSLLLRPPTNHVLISPCPWTARAPRSSSWNGSPRRRWVLSANCTRPATPWDSIRLAVFTASPHTS